jgi:hypothetical protein
VDTLRLRAVGVVGSEPVVWVPKKGVGEVMRTLCTARPGMILEDVGQAATGRTSPESLPVGDILVVNLHNRERNVLFNIITCSVVTLAIHNQSRIGQDDQPNM